MKLRINSATARATTVLLAAMTAACLTPVHAATLYWDGAGGVTPSSWATVANWSTDANSASPDPLAAPTTADDVVFNTTNFNADTTATTAAQIGANSLTFNNTGISGIRSSSGTSRIFNLGAGGITVASNAGAVNLGGSSNTLAIRIESSQTWTNNSTAVNNASLRLHNAVSGPSGASPVTLTVRNMSNGGTTFSNALNDGAGGGSVALVVDSSGSGVTFINGGTFSGGLTVRRGTTQTSSNAPGTSTITFDAATGNTATLRINNAGSVANNIVASTAGGTNVMEFISTSGTVAGNILLNGNLNIAARSSGATGVTINGVISGGGDLIKGQYQGGNSGLLTLAGANTFSGDLTINNGALTLAEAGSLTFYIGANGVSNEVNGSTIGAVAFNGSFNFDLSGAALVDGNSWTLVNLSNESYGASFAITDFTDEDGDNIWTNGGFSFDEATGILTYAAIPEPSTYSLLAGVGVLLLATRRRNRTVRA